ncbi:MAG: hypothetical protein P8074_07715 [Anaerolineales bacterium]|jgi:hypothetical protein
MTKTTIAMGEERPFKLSWIDRFNNWVKKLPVHARIFFIVFGFVLIVVQILFIWLEGGLQDLELLPVIIFNGLFTSFLLALIQFLDNQALVALSAMRPVLDTTEAEFERHKYMLANMPSRAVLIAGLTTVGFAILMERLWITPIRYAALEQLPLFAVVFHIIDKSSAFLFGVFIYHTIRQLRLINIINLHLIRISLFNLRPLQAFSSLTAPTAVGLVVGVYGWIMINPELLTDPVVIGFVGVITILAVAVFILPLVGIHRLMQKEKERLLRALDLNFEAAFSKFNKGFRDDDYAAIEGLNGTIASLEIQHNRIKAIPTWPWKPETAQFALTAIGLPLALTILRFLVEQAFGR